MSTTALQLVNELLPQQRLPRVAEANFLSEESSIIALQVINEGIEKILNDKVWDFSYRNDGLMTTSPQITGTVDVTQDSREFEVQTFSGRSLDWNNPDSTEVQPVRYMLLNDDSAFGMTPWRIRQIESSGPGPFIGYFDRPFRGTTVTDGSYTVVAPEYVFPSNVRDVTSARAQEVPLGIRMIEPSSQLDQYIPRPTEQVNDQPVYIAIGHFASPQLSGVVGQTDELEARLRGFVFPTPLSRYPISYTYTVLYPKLTAFDSTLVGVPETAIREVLKYALAQWMLMPAGNDSELGTAMQRSQRVSTIEARASARRGTAARSSVRPFSTRGVSYPYGRYGWVGDIEGL